MSRCFSNGIVLYNNKIVYEPNAFDYSLGSYTISIAC